MVKPALDEDDCAEEERVNIVAPIAHNSLRFAIEVLIV